MSHHPRFPLEIFIGACTHFLSILSRVLAYFCGLGLCHFSKLVCDLLPRRLSRFQGSPKAYCLRVSLSHS